MNGLRSFSFMRFSPLIAVTLCNGFHLFDQVRHKREATTPTTSQEVNKTALNMATPSSANYAVIFNIVLWVMIAFFLAVLVATYSMWVMDPGKDNIVYRVTSQRMKSD